MVRGVHGVAGAGWVLCGDRGPSSICLGEVDISQHSRSAHTYDHRKFRIDARKVASTNTIRISGGDSECNFDYRAYRTISFDGVANGVNQISKCRPIDDKG